MNPKKPRRVLPGRGGEINVEGKVVSYEIASWIPPAKSRIVRGPDGKLIAIPIPPSEAIPPAPLAGDAPA